jgi:hypothetical protein
VGWSAKLVATTHPPAAEEGSGTVTFTKEDPESFSLTALNKNFTDFAFDEDRLRFFFRERYSARYRMLLPITLKKKEISPQR